MPPLSLLVFLQTLSWPGLCLLPALPEKHVTIPSMRRALPLVCNGAIQGRCRTARFNASTTLPTTRQERPLHGELTRHYALPMRTGLHKLPAIPLPVPAHAAHLLVKAQPQPYPEIPARRSGRQCKTSSFVQFGIAVRPSFSAIQSSFYPFTGIIFYFLIPLCYPVPCLQAHSSALALLILQDMPFCGLPGYQPICPPFLFNHLQQSTLVTPLF